MEDILKKIIETEKIYSEKIHIVTVKYKTKIEELRNKLEDEKNKKIKEIIFENKVKKESAVKKAAMQIDIELDSIRNNKEKLLNNKNLCDKIKQNIISTVL